MHLSYNSGIKIAALKGKAYETATRQEQQEWKDFLDHIWKTLDRLKSVPTGRRILEEIAASGHQCIIFSAGDLMEDPNVCSKWPKSLASDIAAGVVPFRPRHKNVLLKTRETPGAILDHKLELAKLNELKSKAEAAPELINILHRARAKYPDPLRQLPPMLGISTQDLISMCKGQMSIDDKTYYLICLYLYDFLTPGPGCSSTLRIQPYDRMKQLCTELGDWDTIKVGAFETERKKWRDLMAVIMGHELIHAWRIMKGKRIVSAGWEEEAMTAGVGPFLNWPITENQLRKELKMPLRVKYACGGCCSDMMSTLGMYLSSKSSNYQMPVQQRNQFNLPERF